MIGRLNHVAIAVKDLAASTALYRDTLGARVSQPLPQPEHGVTVVFVELPNTKIELLEPTSPESTIAKFIEKNGGRGGVHHVAFNVENVAEALAECEAAGIQLIDKAPRKGAENLMIAFLHPKSTKGVLTELCQQPA